MKRKNAKKILLGALLLLATSSVFATGSIRINSYLDTDLSVVSIINPTETTLNLRIYDEAGNLYYSKKIGGETTSQKLFDFSYLEDGQYKIVLTGKETSIKKEFEIAGNKLAVEDVKKDNEKTLFRTQDNELFITYLSFKNKNFNISITDDSGEEIFKESYNSSPNFSKRFNVKALPKGEYKVRLVSENKEYNYAFRK